MHTVCAHATVAISWGKLPVLLASGGVYCMLMQEFSAEARSSNPAGPSRSWLAVGTSAGAVKVYDSVTGELCWTAAAVNEGYVAVCSY